MKIRVLEPRDIEPLREIHSRFYDKDFPFPDLFDKSLTSYVMEDDDQILCAGNVRTICECVILTNKDIKIAKRRQALLEVIEISRYIVKHRGYTQLHAVVHDQKWERHLKNHGFVDSNGKWLVLGE